MKNTVVKFGFYSGILCSIFLAISSYLHYDIKLPNGLLLGYAGMLIGLSFVVVGIYKKRAEPNTYWTYGTAFKYGITMVFIASLFYVITWQIIFYGFMPDFAENYANTVIEQLKQKGLPEAEMQKQIEGMEKFKENYKNPLFNSGMTFSEIFPVGFFVVLIASIFLRKPKSSSN
ncbi:MAG: DUF4199 domain-containing protein [Bacteroidia bacterium]